MVVEQGRQGNLQKSVMHVHSCCFASLNRRRRFLSDLVPRTATRPAEQISLKTTPCTYINWWEKPDVRPRRPKLFSFENGEVFHRLSLP